MRERGISADNHLSVQSRRQALLAKPLLRRVYEDWYSQISAAIPDVSGYLVEVGSGGGLLQNILPDLIVTDVIAYTGLDVCAKAENLPIASNRVRAIVMINVLHHVPNPRAFFSEANRCLVRGGVIAMVEPWVTQWSRIVYSAVRHERFDPRSAEWGFRGSDPMESSNQALPWIVLERDRFAFESEFPALEIRDIRVQHPLSYIISGGFSFPALAPAFSGSFWRSLEERLRPWKKSLGLFALIIIRKKS
jgi:SAM-dependent methyltransferase